ncbi:MAG: dihydrolipoamide acetyltransferase family protein [Chloroflexi bacterium]|nr:dihydrolipoamide acetyltransferase family protein [Chloroflexota bacterium]
MKIELPQVGESVTEGIIGRWLVSPGDRVEKYDPLVEVITDKVNLEMPSPATGTMSKIIAEEGETVPMGAVIAEMEVEGEEPGVGPDLNASLQKTAEVAEPPVIDRMGVLIKNMAPVGPTGSGGPSAPIETEGGGDRGRRYSPAVRRLAEQHGVDLALITGTGIGGRVTRADVQASIDSGARPVRSEGPDEARVPLTPLRRMIAQNMVKSTTEIPQAWSSVEVDVTGIVTFREAVKDEFRAREGVNLTYLAFALHAVAAALKENPLLNSSWDGDAILIKHRTNIGVAVAAPVGLLVPVIHDADKLTITGLALAVDSLSEKARQGKLSLENVQGGTFTVNNTGVLGSVVSRALVNYPQAAILTTEAIVKRPVVIDDAIAIRSIMNVGLTFDHRIVDGAEASAFTGSVKRHMEAMDHNTRI